MVMKMCKYCGGLIGNKSFGPKGAYCKHECVEAVFGFDDKLQLERQHGKLSLSAYICKGGDVSDGGTGAESIIDSADQLQAEPEQSRSGKVREAIFNLQLSGQLDATDLQIIKMLTENPSPSNRNMAARLNLTHTAINKKVSRIKTLLSTV